MSEDVQTAPQTHAEASQCWEDALVDLIAAQLDPAAAPTRARLEVAEAVAFSHLYAFMDAEMAASGWA